MIGIGERFGAIARKAERLKPSGGESADPDVIFDDQ